MTATNCHSLVTKCPPTSQAKTSPSCLSLALLPGRMVAASLSSATEVLKKTLDGAYADYCSCCGGHHKKSDDCCEIPETDCPSQIVCQINWEGCAGDTLRHHISVTNTSTCKRDFSFSAKPFSCSNDSIKLTPPKKTLLPDEQVNILATFVIPENFSGSSFTARIVISGAYEQYILVRMNVRPKQDCCCEVKQGDIPTRIKAHNWYHHFQCEEQCFEPAKREK